MNSFTPTYSSGGGEGEITKYVHTADDGVTLFMAQGTGMHMISIWPSGISFWSKHNNMLEQQAASQFVGTCTNI